MQGKKGYRTFVGTQFQYRLWTGGASQTFHDFMYGRKTFQQLVRYIFDKHAEREENVECVEVLEMCYEKHVRTMSDEDFILHSKPVSREIERLELTNNYKKKMEEN